MISRHLNPARWAALTAAMLVGCALSASAVQAQTRTETLRWQHDEAERVTQYQAEVGNAPGSYNRSIDLGLPTPNGSGIYSADISVGATEDVYIVLRARGDDGNWSDRSAYRFRAAPPPPDIGPTPVPGEVLDFESNPVGAGANGWLDTAANFSLTEDDSLFDIADVGGTRALHSGSSASDVHSHLMASDFETTNYTLSGRMRSDATSASMGVTIASRFPSEARYYRLEGRPGSSDGFKLAHPMGSWSCSSNDTGVSMSAGQWYRFELSVEDLGTATRVWAKVWADGDAEQSSHQQECTDSSGSHIDAGTFGAWSSGAGDRYWDEFEQSEFSSGGNGGGATTISPPVLIGVTRID